jgi:hypothetical protein
MSLLFWCLRLALIAYVLALTALYFFQDRFLLPSTPHVTDIDIGRHASYEVQPWHPNGQYSGYVVVPDARELLAARGRSRREAGAADGLRRHHAAFGEAIVKRQCFEEGEQGFCGACPCRVSGRRGGRIEAGKVEAARGFRILAT